MKNDGYQYICEDKSVLYPILKRFVWAPALPSLPAWLSPNTMTLLGSFFAWASFAVLLVLQPEDSTWFLVPALMNFLYLSLDNMDGMQARRANRSSPLGEFLDHWSDGFNTGLMVFGYGVAMKTPPWFVVLMLSLVCTAYFSCFWEQEVTGRLYFGKGGSIEGVMYIVGMYLLVAAFGHDLIATSTPLGPLSFSNATLVLVGVCFVLTFLSAIRRVGRRAADYLPHAIVFTALGVWFALGRIPLIPMGFVIVFAGAYLGGRTVVARVLREPFRAGDRILYFLIAACMAVALGADLSADGQTLAAVPILTYLVFRLAGDFSRTVSTLRHHLLPGELLARFFPRT
jgi:phosphatidylglycerophosphate synthase